MKTTLEDWEKFKAVIYPGGMEDEQHKQVYYAFVAGSFMTMEKFLQLADLPDAEAERLFLKLTTEIKQAGTQICANIKARN